MYFVSALIKNVKWHIKINKWNKWNNKIKNACLAYAGSWLLTYIIPKKVHLETCSDTTFVRTVHVLATIIPDSIRFRVTSW